MRGGVRWPDLYYRVEREVEMERAAGVASGCGGGGYKKIELKNPFKKLGGRGRGWKGRWGSFIWDNFSRPRNEVYGRLAPTEGKLT